MSFSAFLGILALDENYVFDNALSELVKKMQAWSIVVAIGVDVDADVFMIGPHIYEGGAQFLELRGVIPHEVSHHRQSCG